MPEIKAGKAIALVFSFFVWNKIANTTPIWANEAASDKSRI